MWVINGVCQCHPREPKLQNRVPLSAGMDAPLSVSDLSKGLQDEKAEVPCPVVGLKLVGCLGQPQGAQMPQAGWHTTV